MNGTENIANKRAIDLTGGELAEIIISKMGEIHRPKEKKYVFGLEGIQQLFSCSKSKACSIAKEIEGAISRNGRIMVIDSEKAIELFGKRKGGRRIPNCTR